MGNGGTGGRGRRRPGTAAGKLVMRPDFDDPLPEEMQAAFEGREPGRDPARYAIVELGGGGQVNRTQTPEGVDLVILDADAYLEPPLDRTRQDLEPYERCGSCGEARKVHAGPERSGPVLWEDVSCPAFEPTGTTLGGDPLSDWEDR